MTAEIKGRLISCLINGVNWSDRVNSCTLQWEEFNLESGLVKATATIEIDCTGLTPLPSYRLDPTQWAKGTAVIFQVTDSLGTLRTPNVGGKGQILEEPAPAFNRDADTAPTITLQVGCTLSINNFREADADVSGIVTGVATARNVVISNILTAATAPNNISATPYPINYAIPKPGGSFVQQAGKVAASANRLLYQQNSGTVLDAPVDLNPATAYFSLTVGTDETIWEPDEGVEIPVETLTVDGITYTVSPNGYLETVATDLGFRHQIDLWDFVTPFTQATIQEVTTQIFAYDAATKSQKTVITTKRPRVALGLISNRSDRYDLITAEIKTDTNFYDANGRLERQTCEVKIPKTITVTVVNETTFIVNGLTFDWSVPIISELLESFYTYSDDALLSQLRVVRSVQQSLFDYTSATTLRPAEENISTWEKLGKDHYLFRKVRNLARILKYPFLLVSGAITLEDGTVVRTDQTLQFEMLFDSGSTFLANDGSANPPQTIYRRDNDLIEKALKSTVTFQALAGNLYRKRERAIVVEYATTEEQLYSYGTTYNGLLWGRRFGWLVGCPINDLMLASTLKPLCRVDVTHGTTIYRLLMDALTLVFTQDEAFATFRGIEIGVSTVAAPTVVTSIYTPVVTAALAGVAGATMAGAAETSGNVLAGVAGAVMTAEGTNVIFASMAANAGATFEGYNYITGAMTATAGAVFTGDGTIT